MATNTMRWVKPLLILFTVFALCSTMASAATTVEIIPSSKTVAQGETFTVSIQVTPDEPLRGAQVDLSYGDSLLGGASATDGAMFANFVPPAAGTGTLSQISGYQMPSDATVSTQGNLATVQFTASSTNAGTTQLDLSGVKVKDANGDPLPAEDVTVIGGTVTVTANDPPTVTVTSPVSGTVIGTIPVTATAADTDGTVEQVAFYLMPADALIDTDTDSTGGWSVQLDTTTAADGTGYYIRAVATDNEGATGENTGSAFAIDNSCQCNFCLDLEAGLNFVSIPKTIDSPKNATTIFDIDPFNGEVCWYYDAAAGIWDDNADVKPCRGYLVRKNAPMEICENFDDGAATPSQQLYKGWNMIGAVSMDPMPIHNSGIDDTDFASVTGLENPEGTKLFIQMNAYIPGTGWINYPTGPLTEVTPGMGYTIVMTENATMYGIP